MEPTVVIVVAGAVVAALVALGGQARPQAEPIPVRVDDQAQQRQPRR